MEHEEITHKIIGCAYTVFNKLGFGFLESVYQKAMIIELSKSDLDVESEKSLKVYYDDQVVGDFYVDLYINKAVVVELKSVQNLNKEHEVQVVNYLNALEKEIGLLINFGPTGVKVKRKYRKITGQDQQDFSGCSRKVIYIFLSPMANCIFDFLQESQKKIQQIL